MPFTFKLSQRLARMRRAALLCSTAALAACEKPGVAGPSEPGSQVVTLIVSPDSITLTPSQSEQFVAFGRTPAGDSVPVAVVWSASGGTIAASGLYTADSIEGAYQVTAAPMTSSLAASHTSTVIGKATVRVSRGRKLTRIIVSPASTTLSVDGTQQFLAYGRMNNGDSVAVSVTWSATGGTITTAGLYRAGQTPGSYAVTAAQTGGSLTGTASVAVTAPPPSSVPGTVTNLALAGVTDNSVTLAFTEVSDGTGQPASYDVRYAPSPFSWGSATSVATGTCASPVHGSSIGASRTCTVLGLSAATAYGFQLVALRGTLGVDAVFGGLSNAASGATAAGTQAPVASVTVSPGSAGVSVLGTQQFTATLKDASGAVLTGRSVSWSVSNPLVASVSGLGLVTGLVAGTATLTATSEGQRGQASVTVTVLPPPPSGSWGGSGWWSIYNGSGYVTRVSDAGAPSSPSNVVDFYYPIGFPSGIAPGTLYYYFSTAREVYVGLWWKPSNPWQGNDAGRNKICYLMTAGDKLIALEIFNQSAPYSLGVVTEFPGDNRAIQGAAPTPVALGQWHRLEWYLKYSSSGSTADGVMKVWLDGKLEISRTDLVMPADGGFSLFQLSPTFGGVGSAKYEADHFWFDHIHISGN